MFYKQSRSIYKYTYAPKNTVIVHKLIQNMRLYSTTLQCFIDELQLCVVRGPWGDSRVCCWLVTLWVATVTMHSIQGANSITRSIEEMCDVVFTCVFLESLHLLVYDFMI